MKNSYESRNYCPDSFRITINNAIEFYDFKDLELALKWFYKNTNLMGTEDVLDYIREDYRERFFNIIKNRKINTYKPIKNN